jgi:hypothetical protein
MLTAAEDESKTNLYISPIIDSIEGPHVTPATPDPDLKMDDVLSNLCSWFKPSNSGCTGEVRLVTSRIQAAGRNERILVDPPWEVGLKKNKNLELDDSSSLRSCSSCVSPTTSFSLPATPYYDYYHPPPSVLITMHMGTVLVLPHNPLSPPQHASA